jgi:hypothetical protein
MYRRLLLPVMTVTALLTLFLTVVPTPATGAPRMGDEYVVNRDASIDQPVSGSLQVYNGNVVIANVIEGDLLVLGGSARFVGNGAVRGNLIFAASTVEGAEDRVRGHVYPLASLEGAAASLAASGVVASLLVIWLVVAVVVTLLNGREVRASSVEVRASALHCFVLGLVAFTSFILTAIAFSYLVPYVVGIPMLAALAVFGILTKVYGMIAVFHAVGTLVAGARTRRQLESRQWLRGDLAMVVVGLLILGAIRLIPGVGTVVWGLASIFGVGVALATRFGRREPWFLEFRSAVA